MLLYSLLYLAGVHEVAPGGEVLSTPAVSLDDIKNFRQLAARPRPSEYGLTTGSRQPLARSVRVLRNSVGMAIAERWLAQYFNRPGFELFNYNIWAICGDGDMMEGISSEAASIAGHLELSNLCWIYDNNHITSKAIPISPTTKMCPPGSPPMVGMSSTSTMLTIWLRWPTPTLTRSA